MSGGKHTPGPWTACKDGECSCGQVFAGGDKHVATVHAETRDSDGTTYAEWPEEERQANVRLIAAAPDLLEAAELLARAGAVTYEGATCPICSYPTNEHSMGCPVSYATRAIAKAKGDRS